MHTTFDFSNYQYRILREVVIGLTKRQEREIGLATKSDMILNCKIANSVLDDWKIEICNNLSFWKRVKLAKKYGADFSKKCSMKELGITLQMVADKLILEGMLPANFYSLR